MRITRGMFLAAFFASGVALTGCAIYRSEEITGGGDVAPGMLYYLPKSLVAVTVTPYGLKTTVGTTVTEQVKYVEISVDDDAANTVKSKNIPDLSRQYVLNYRPNAFTTDHICAGEKDGLLLAVEAASADETGNIIVSIAKLAGRLMAPQPGGFGRDALDAEDDNVVILSGKFTVLLDPLDPSDRRDLVKKIKARFPKLARKNYTFEVDGEHQLRENGLAECPVDSVCYRTAVTTRLSLVDAAPNGHTSNAYAKVINRSVTGHIDVSRAFMVEKITRLTFEEGMLSGVAIRKPSEALAVAKLPLTVVDAVMTSLLAAPGNFLANASGMSAADRLTAAQNAQSNAVAIVGLQAQLATLRNGDDAIIGRFDPTANDSTFKIRCDNSDIGKSGP